MSKFYSIKCPNCSAPLAIIGGGRVQSVTCAYCKSVIDLNNNYKILSQFKNVNAPKVPFKIGMKGKINDIEWIIIGWIVYRDEEGGRWSEFLLFSPLYGYSWLVYENGVISFSRRIRDLDLRKWQKGERLPLFYNGGHYILQDGEPYSSFIDFVQGELTWVAKKGDKIECWDYKATKSQILNIEKSNNEIEVYFTKELDAKEVYNSFGVNEKEQIIKKISSIEKLNKELEDKKPLPFYGIVAIFITLFITLISSITSDKVLYEKFDKNRDTLFRITNSAFLTKIEITSPLKKRINNYSLAIYKQNKKIFYIDSGKVYFSKKVLGKTWSHTAIGANIYLKLDTGQYLLKVKKITPSTDKIIVKIEERVIRPNYITPLFIIILLFLIYTYFRQKLNIYVMMIIFMGLGLAFDIFFLFFIGFIGLIYLRFVKGGD